MPNFPSPTDPSNTTNKRLPRPVERRGREIGALFARRILNPESNLCYGEGGAGTWSDGKLTTRREVDRDIDASGGLELKCLDLLTHTDTHMMINTCTHVRTYTRGGPRTQQQKTERNEKRADLGGGGKRV